MVEYYIPVFKTEPSNSYCSLTYEFEVEEALANSSIVQLVEDERKLTFSSSYEVSFDMSGANFKDYVVTIKGVFSYSAFRLKTFNLRIRNPCRDSSHF